MLFFAGFPARNRVATRAGYAVATDYGRRLCKGSGAATAVHAGRPRDTGNRSVLLFVISGAVRDEISLPVVREKKEIDASVSSKSCIRNFNR